MQNNRTKEELRWSSKGYVQSDEEKRSCGRRQLRNRPKKRHSNKRT
nr:DNA primase [Salmonella enterica subsp. enterica serovar Rissen]